MKIGVRKPSIKKSISARTTGRITRAAKKSVNPFYGKKGMGLITDPEKAAKNAIYKRTTVGARDIYKHTIGSSSGSRSSYAQDQAEVRRSPRWMYFLALFLFTVLFLLCLVLTVALPAAAVGLIVCPIVIYRYWKRFKEDYPPE